MDREKVIKGLEQIVNDPFMKARADYWVLVCSEAIDLLKAQEEQIERLERDLAVTQNNLNYYVNGND